MHVKIKQKGFTFIEVLIALSIVGGALITIIYTLNWHLSLLQQEKDITQGVFIAKKLLYQWKSAPDKSKIDWIPLENGFQYKVIIEESPVLGIYILKVKVKKNDKIVILKKFLRL